MCLKQREHISVCYEFFGWTKSLNEDLSQLIKKLTFITNYSECICSNIFSFILISHTNLLHHHSSAKGITKNSIDGCIFTSSYRKRSTIWHKIPYPCICKTWRRHFRKYVVKLYFFYYLHILKGNLLRPKALRLQIA